MPGALWRTSHGWTLARPYSPNCLEKLSEKGYEQRSEREFGRYTEEEMGPWVVCRATLQALSTLFGQFLEGEFRELRL